MQDKDTGTKRVAIVGPAGIGSSMRRALTLLATTHCVDFVGPEDIDWDMTNNLRDLAMAMRKAEVETDGLNRQLQRYLEIKDELPWDGVFDYGAHLNFEEQQKLKTKGRRSKQRRKW